MNIVEDLEEVIAGYIKKLDVSSVSFAVEPASDLSHGDYTTSAPLALAKHLKQNPRDVAEALALHIRSASLPYIDHIDVAGAGFVNIWMTKESLNEVVVKATREATFGKNDELAEKKIIVEYTDPNPFKEFHIGHLMTNVIGQSLSNIIEANGAEVRRVCYQGDVGMHVAMAMWGKLKDPKLPWGKAYAFGATSAKENESVKKEIQVLNKKIYDRSEEEVNTLYDQGRKESLVAFDVLYRTLGTSFDEFFFESQTAPLGLEIVSENREIFEESDGALIYRGEQDGLHTRVFINREGLPTYEAKELALAPLKYQWYPFTHSIVVTANEINDYYRVIVAVVSKIFPDLAKRLEHVGHGMLRLPTGKMSSRTGDVITAESLINDVRERVLDKMKDNELSLDERGRVATQVAVGALKYAILRQAPGKDVIFDMEKSVSFEGDSGPYLQYTHARLRSVLRKARTLGVDMGAHIDDSASDSLLARKIGHFPFVVRRAEEERAPQYIATYLIDIARSTNAWYAHTQIVDEQNILESGKRLLIVLALARILENGLWMLGITAPDKM